jgi:uncharacterized protein (TIGR02145 family)
MLNSDPDKNKNLVDDRYDVVPNQAPASPSNPNPTNIATGTSISPTLTWECSDPDGDALTYDVYFGTDNPPATKVSTAQTAKSLARSGLTAGTTYFWKVVAKDSKGANTEGSVWKFTTQTASGSAPVADFTASKTSITKGETIQFTDKSTNAPTSWLWTFGDGTTSNLQNPIITYSTAGNYTVSLKATNSFGNNTKTLNITVSEPSNQAPIADFTASKTNITKGETIQFTDKSTNSPTSWLWDFGDGTTSTQQNPLKSFNSVGNYTVTLKATNSFGNSTKTTNITVSEQSEIKYGEMVYDGRTYKTVIINGKEWMAENLAYLPAVYPTLSLSYTEPRYNVYGYQGTDIATAKQQPNYITYGVLYNWFAAKAACPPGWHLPSDEEWKQLEMALGMTKEQADATGSRGTDQGKQMKATSGWFINGNGFNTSGFSALPGGNIDYITFFNIEKKGFWLSSTEGDANLVWIRILEYGNEKVQRGLNYKGYCFSVRCVRD